MVYVHANGAVGGLLGWNHRGQVNHCYSTGRPVGAASVGGLCGGVTTGGGYEDTGNFWDIGASQTIESAMGTGRTTREMQTLSTFSDAGWDFLLTWSIDEGTDYPRLKWWPPTGTYSGGDGTEDDPYRIGTTADLQELIGTPGDWDKRFVLTSNLDAAGELLAPVGDNTVPFTGAFNGAGRTISNIVINRPGDDCVGPFGYVGLGGRIENLTVVNVYVRGRGDIGGLVGFNDIGRITGCRATGTVVGTGWRVGGLVGGSYRGTTEYCYAECSVTGSGQVGGLIGHCDDGQTVACDAAGKVAGTGHYVGGLVGYSHGTPLHFCSAAACVSGTGDYVGGLAGYTSYHVSCCYATGTVSGTENVGGLVGYAHEYDGTFVNSYATGAVNGSRAVGGLVGRVHLGKIAHCYSTGKPAGIEYVGGLCGRSITGGQGNFWDTETSETTVSTMAAGRTTEQMQMRSTFLDAGWDFGQTWAICEGTNYPRLRWSIPAGDLLCPDGVSFEDMGYFAGRWLMEDCGLTGGCDGADLTGDGRVDMGDLAILGGSWGQP
ncbi:MAG TPA: hypothetical protein ENN81_12370 [Phycisphaerales bacterium]|nr:hypothetical protein [Phycisphaerales bacterium]